MFKVMEYVPGLYEDSRGVLSGKKVFRGYLEFYRDSRRITYTGLVYKGYLRLDRDSRGVIWGLYRVEGWYPSSGWHT